MPQVGFDQLLVPLALAPAFLGHEDPDVAVRGPETDGNDPRRRKVCSLSQAAPPEASV